MSKNISTSIITYGATLPPPESSADGALFNKISSADGIPTGLYVFRFNPDAQLAIGAVGDQVQQGWYRIDATQLDADTLDGFDSTYFQPQSANLLGISSVGTPGIYVRTGVGSATSRSIVSGSARISVTNPTGVTGNPTIDVAEANVLLQNLGGTLPVIKGGTGSTTPATPGGVVFASSNSVLSTTPAGTSGQVLVSGGAGSPVWTSQSALSVGSAANATNSQNAVNAQTANALATPRLIQITGSLTGSASFDGSSNIAINVALTPPLVTVGGDQTIGGVKTFTDIIVGNISGNAATANVANSVINGVDLTSAQTVSGVKTFSNGVRFADGTVQHTAIKGAIMFRGSDMAVATARRLSVAKLAGGRYRVFLDPVIQGGTPGVVVGSNTIPYGTGLTGSFAYSFAVNYVDIGVDFNYAFNAGNTDDFIIVTNAAGAIDTGYYIGVLIF